MANPHISRTVRLLGIKIIRLNLILIGLLAIYLLIVIPLDHPKPADMSSLELERLEIRPGLYTIGNNWCRKTQSGTWEIYVEGNAFERGVIYGKLLSESIQHQEDIFVSRLEKMLPSSIKRFALKLAVGWFNRDLDKEIPEEFQEEILGISYAFSDAHDNIAPKYQRILNYHAAHDIGHALNDYSLVGCTSYAVNKENAADSKLLIGRNFDFSMGDKFSREKVISIFNPSEGYGFVFVSWAGFVGVVSGMNENGLTVTINAAQSVVPTSAKTPISILAREILQYASTLEEAIAIAGKREVFVSEGIMVGSSIENKAISIEKTPEGMAIYDSQSSILTCSNHYQSDEFANSESNLNNIKQSDSKYRLDRLNELIGERRALTVEDAASILRNRRGLGGKFIGLGNPKSINQLLAHHSVIFKPEAKLMWISSYPYQLGAYICYDLNLIFGSGLPTPDKQYTVDSLKIRADTFLRSTSFKDFNIFRERKETLLEYVNLGGDLSLSENEILELVKLNPESYESYLLIGQYFIKENNTVFASSFLEVALSKELPSLKVREKIKKMLNELE